MTPSPRPLPATRAESPRGVGSAGAAGLLTLLLTSAGLLWPAAASARDAGEGEVAVERTERVGDSNGEAAEGESSGGESDLVPLFDPGAAPSSSALGEEPAPTAPEVAGPEPAGPEPAASAASPTGDGAGLVPLFDPASTSGSSATAAAAGESSRWPVTAPSSPPPPMTTDASAPVPLFDPDGSPPPAGDASRREAVEIRTPEESYGPLDSGFDSDPGDDPAPPARPAFDLEAARRALSRDMAPPPDLLPVEEAMEVVEPVAVDGELGASSLRGSSELGLDLRSLERFRWECRNEVGRRDVTLFGNGTVRLRTGPLDAPEMRLDELGDEALLGYLSRLARIQRSRALRHDVAGREDFGQVDGELGEACRVTLRLPDQPPVSLTMPRLEVPQLGLGQLVAIADELARYTRPLDRPRQVRTSYVPAAGDQLRRRDGHYFRVVALTSDGGGVEVEGIQEPVRIFYRVADLPRLFEPVEGSFDDAPPIEPTEPEVREIVGLGGG